MNKYAQGQTDDWRYVPALDPISVELHASFPLCAFFYALDETWARYGKTREGYAAADNYRPDETEQKAA